MRGKDIFVSPRGDEKHSMTSLNHKSSQVVPRVLGEQPDCANGRCQYYFF